MGKVGGIRIETAAGAQIIFWGFIGFSELVSKKKTAIPKKYNMIFLGCSTYTIVTHLGFRIVY